MKRLMAGTLVLAASLMLGTVASAAATEIMKGTPVIDGKMDAIYGKTLALPSADTKVFCGSSVDWSAADPEETDTRATVYLMYDDSYFYVFGDVTDSYAVKNVDSTQPESNPWDNDAVENWIDLGNGVKKTSVSPFIPYVFGDAEPDPATCKFASVKTDKGYAIELAIPATGLTAGRAISYVLQLNDYGKDGYIRCFGAQAAGVEEYKLGK